MFDHVKFGVSDYAASKAFFLKALEPLGVAVVSEGPPTYGVELSRKGRASLCLYEAGASSLGVHGRESPASRSFLSRGSGGGWQRQWCAWSVPGIPRELLCSFRHRSGRAQHRSGLPRTRGLTLPSRGRPQAGFAHLRPPLMSNVRWIRAFSSLELGLGQRLSLPCKFSVFATTPAVAYLYDS